VSSRINIKTNENLEFIPELLVGGGGEVLENTGWEGCRWGEGKGWKAGFLRWQEEKEMQKA